MICKNSSTLWASNASLFTFLLLLGIAVSYIEDALCIRLLAELFVELLLLTISVTIFSQWGIRWVRQVIVFVAYFLAIIDVACYIVTGSAISPLLLQLALQTNENEATEAVCTYFSWKLVWEMKWIWAVLLGHVIWASMASKRGWEKNVNKLIVKWFTIKTVPIVLFLILSCCMLLSMRNIKGMYKILTADQFCFEHAMANGSNNHSLTIGFYQPIYRLLYAVKALRVKSENVKKSEHIVTNFHKNVVVNIETVSPLPYIVVIFGESYNRHHSQLYGYNMPTTPYQVRRQRNGELVPFSDVITSWNYTTNSFELMMSLFSYGQKGNWYDYPCFPVVFRKAGYHVAFISNQFVINKKRTEKTDDFSFGDIFLNNSKVSASMFDVRNNYRHAYDLDLISECDSLIKKNANNNLVMIHLLGQHTAYKDRYPSDSCWFNIRGYNRPELNSEQIEVLANYDNATRYNDVVVENILKYFDSLDAVAIYVPDHGEMCFDGSLMFGRTTQMSQNAIYQQYEIPFWIWGSKSFRQKHNKVWQSIENAKDRKFMTDNIGQLLIGLAGIKYDGYNSANDLLSPDYEEKRPRLMRGEIDYDVFMKGYIINNN